MTTPGDPLERERSLWDALPRAPRAPAFSGVLERLDRPAAPARPGPRGGLVGVPRWFLWPAIAAVAAAVLFVVLAPSLGRSGSGGGSAPVVAVRVAPVRGPVTLERDGIRAAFGDARTGDVLVSEGPAAVTIGERATVTLSNGTRLALISDASADLLSGGVRVALGTASSAPFVLRAAERRVEDAGTRFTAVLVPHPDLPSLEFLSVAVEEGAVTVDGVRVEAGSGVAVSAYGDAPPRPERLPRPALGLETAEPEVVAGAPTRLRLFLANVSPYPLPNPVFDEVAAPVFLEVTDPQGNVRTLKATEEAAVEGEPQEPWLVPAQGGIEARLVTVRFASLFPVPGAYRLRAVFRSEDGVAAASPPLEVDAR